MPIFGSVPEFDEAVEEWPMYTGRLQQFFEANDIEEDKQRSIFLAGVGPKTYRLLHTLLNPVRPAERTFVQLIETLNTHYSPVPSEITQRYKFLNRVRKPEESISTFVSELRKLAEHCNFGNTLDTMLRDRIVCGVQNSQIQTALLADGNLTLEQATQKAIAIETATKDALDLRSTASGFSANREVNKVQHSQGFQKSQTSHWKTKKKAHNNFHNSPQQSYTNNMQCIRCGSYRHKPSDCPHIETECHKCSKVGHLARKCLTKTAIRKPSNNASLSGKKDNRQVHGVDSEQLQHNEYDLFHVINLKEPPRPMVVKLIVNNKLMPMELDTGSAYSIVSEETYKKMEHPPILKPVETKLKSFTGHSINILGRIEVEVRLIDTSLNHKLELLVVSGNRTNLCGRNWISALDLINTNINQIPCSEKRTLDDILEKHKNVFNPGLGKLKNVQVHLSIKENAQPIFCKARSVPYAMKKMVSEELDRLVDKGILTPIRHSNWAAPIVPVMKSDHKTIRICGDFKMTVNPVSNTEKYPLPKAEDIFSQLAGGKKFTKLDLREAYNQLELDEDSRNIVVINTQKGLFQYTRMPYGVSSASAIFQREAEILLQDVDRVSAYQDDIIVTGEDDESHLNNLDLALTRIEEAGLRLKLEKCEFFKDSILFLGHKLDASGLHPDEKKLEAIRDAPVPQNVHELRSFMGLITYYSKFLPQMSTRLAPLNSLLCKDKQWTWGDKENDAFEDAKSALQDSTLLVHFDPERPLTLSCDASPYGLGAVISHVMEDGEEKPIAFASRSLASAEKNYSHIEKEALAIIFGIVRFRDYLFGKHFVLYTDHRPLTTLFSESKGTPTITSARIQRWSLMLSAYNYNIRYKQGSENLNADAFSRLPLPCKDIDIREPPELVLQLMTLNEDLVTATMIEEQTFKDPVLMEVMDKLKCSWNFEENPDLHQYWLKRNELSVFKNIIFRGDRVVIPKLLRNSILKELHMGHQGIVSLKRLARSKVWWPGVDQDLESVVKNCNICQEQAAMPAKNVKAWPEETTPWTRIHLDFAGPVEGKMLLIVIDAYTKWLEVFVTPATSSSTVKVLYELFARFGIPKCIVTDNGTSFTAHEFTTFCENNGIRHVRTSPYHPCSNGQAERAVQIVKKGLKKMTSGTFETRLSSVLLSYRRTPFATGLSPAENMFGRKIRSRLDLIKPEKQQKDSTLRDEENVTRFQIDKPVWYRNFGKGPKWKPGKIHKFLGNTMYEISTPDENVKRHQDQMRPRTSSTEHFEATCNEEQEFVTFGTCARDIRMDHVPLHRDVGHSVPVPEQPVLRRSARARKPPDRLGL